MQKCLDGIFVAKVASQLPTLFIVAAASGLRIGELLALHNDDIDFENSTVRVDESVDRTGIIGPCKNVAAFRTVVLADKEGQHTMRALKQFVKHDGLIFRSKRSYRSSDGGNTWCLINTGIDFLDSILAFDAADPARIFLGTRFGVLFSEDRGNSFKPIYPAGR